VTEDVIKQERFLMEARLKNPAVLLSDAMQPLMALGKLAYTSGKVPAKTLALVHIRISQINGCAACLAMHHHQDKTTAAKGDEVDDRLFFVSVWHEYPAFTEAERAALALAEAETRLADRDNAVPDEVWNEAARHYDEQALATLVLYIGMVNLYNRLNVTTKQVPGAHSG
jgi:AhpD family alkylhydroperoxidase